MIHECETFFEAFSKAQRHKGAVWCRIAREGDYRVFPNGRIEPVEGGIHTSGEGSPEGEVMRYRIEMPSLGECIGLSIISVLFVLMLALSCSRAEAAPPKNEPEHLVQCYDGGVSIVYAFSDGPVRRSRRGVWIFTDSATRLEVRTSAACVIYTDLAAHPEDR